MMDLPEQLPRMFHMQGARLDKTEFKPKRNHTNVTITTRDSRMLVKRQDMKGFIPKRSHTNADIATSLSHN